MKLTSQIRDTKDSLETLRAAGTLPAVCYGKAQDSVSLKMNTKEFQTIYKQAGGSAIIELDIDGDSHDVFVKEVQYHPVSGDMLHVDLYAFTKGETMEVTVPFSFIGEAPAEKLGAVLNKVHNDIVVEAFPRNIPGEIVVDLSMIVEVGNSIHVKDLVFPEGVKSTIDENETVVSSFMAVEIEEDEVVTEIDMDAIVSEKKGKKEEEGEGEEA